ncbi:MAG TPA: peptidoglycan DD-metalloendopeptidase family protein [Hyphomicrobium sp.]|nr:peptidoglycan DD-metalloendopeptidase family protein [Hyphomicrobium sp.]
MMRVEVRIMKYWSGFGRRGGFGLKPAHCAAIVLSAAASGCSADVTRFDNASFNLDDPPQATSSVDTANATGTSDYPNPVRHSQRPGPYGAGGPRGGVETAPLPDATPSSAYPQSEPIAAAPTMPERSRPLYRPAGEQRVAMATPPSSLSQPARGQAIEVQAGDTLYGLSRRHQVSLAELMSANGLTSPDIKPGQKLFLPSGGAIPQTVAAAPSAAPALAPIPARQFAPPSVSPETAVRYNGSYTMQPGDSIYAVARTHKVPFTELQQVNGITNPLKVRAGTVLKVPAAYPQTAAAPIPTTAAIDAGPQPGVIPAAVPVSPVPPASGPAATEPANIPAAVPATSAQPTIINSAQPAETVAPAPPVSSSDVAPKGDRIAIAVPAEQPAAADGKLRWPAQGRIISGFGGRPDGTHNDGVNLSVPMGTDVHAAESGVIAYAGSELKGYGNLILIRHDNGWVTAYAHNDQLLVKRGDKVSRGQVIAKAGKTGTVDQPQVHFELRQGSKPVDPAPFMEPI